MSPQTILKMQDSMYMLAKIFLTEFFLTSFWNQVLIRAVQSCISSYIQDNAEVLTCSKHYLEAIFGFIQDSDNFFMNKKYILE